MIAQWMLHALTVTTFLTIAATVTERALRLWKKQARLVWAAATLLSVIIPLVSLARLTGLLAPAEPDRLPAAVGVLLAPIVVRAPSYDVDVILALGWAAASLLLTLRFVGAARWLAKRRASWHAIDVDGERMFVSRDAGPAVVGFRRPTIVVPEWVLELDESLRALVLEHEREHRDRGDPRLLLSTLMVAVALPWNLPLWYCLTRLRSAMELDCDLRVLRTYPDSRKYGSLLLAVAQRADRAGLLTAALTESNSLLGRRILAMRTPIARRRLARTIGLLAVAGTLTAVACETQPPTTTKVGVTEPKKPGPVVASEPYFEFQVEEPVRPAPSTVVPRYPDMLRRAGVQGEVLVQFIVDREGRAEPQSLKILESDHDLFSAAVRNVLPQMQFMPARVGGKAVKQVVQQPFTFSLSH